MIDPYHDYGLAPDDMPPYLADLHEALSLLNSVLGHVPSEYGVRRDILERYEKLKAKYEVTEIDKHYDISKCTSW